MSPMFEDTIDTSNEQKFQLPDIIKLSTTNIK